MHTFYSLFYNIDSWCIYIVNIFSSNYEGVPSPQYESTIPPPA